MKKSNTAQKGFSLVELMVVISILAVLAALGLATMGKARVNSQTTATKALIKSLYTAIEAYNQEVGYYPEPQGNTYISDRASGATGVKILGKNAGLRKYFSFTDNDLDNAIDRNLVDSFGAQLNYNYTDSVTLPTGVTVNDIGHDIYIYSYGPDGKSSTAAEREDDIYIKAGD